MPALSSYWSTARRTISANLPYFSFRKKKQKTGPFWCKKYEKQFFCDEQKNQKTFRLSAQCLLTQARRTKVRTT
jgi:hypothetical protein